MRSKTSIVKGALFEVPSLIKVLLKSNRFDGRMVRHTLSRYLPYSLGVEIECGDRLDVNTGLYQRHMAEHFGIQSYSNDTGANDKMKEHRIRFDGYRQAYGFWKILEAMKEHCTVNTIGGLHIHVDLTHTFGSRIPNLAAYELKEFIEYRFERIQECWKYDGHYSTVGVGVDDKTYQINIRTNLCTVEFRMGYCTFDYETIIRWAHCSSMVVKEFVKWIGTTDIYYNAHSLRG